MSVNCQLHRGVVLAYKSWGKSDTTTITIIVILSKIESVGNTRHWHLFEITEEFIIIIVVVMVMIPKKDLGINSKTEC